MTSVPTNPNRKLLREDRWSRRYQIDSHDVYESKMAVGNATICLEELEREWESWDIDQRFEFVRAFSCKSTLSGDDEKIIEFLIHQQDQRLSAMMAPCLALHSDKEMVFDFLVEHLRIATEDCGNFLQALASLGDKRAVPTIYNFYRHRLAKFESGYTQAGLDDGTRDLLMSCVVLGKLTEDPKYLSQLHILQEHENEEVRRYASLLLKIWFPVD